MKISKTIKYSNKIFFFKIKNKLLLKINFKIIKMNSKFMKIKKIYFKRNLEYLDQLLM